MLVSNQIYLRPLDMSYATDDYVAWMNNYEITKYTESRFILHTRNSLERFVNEANDANTHTLAIVLKENEKHIGNIKLGGINWDHRWGDIGLIIGCKEYFGRGIATESICLVTDYAFRQLGLHKVCAVFTLPISARCAHSNKAGFDVYATEPQKCFFKGKYVDCHYLHKINDFGETL